MGRYNYDQPDPRYFQFGNAFLGGMDQAQDNRRRDQLVNIEQQQQALMQRRYEEMMAQEQAAQQQAQTRDSLSRQEYARLFKEAGLNPGLAYTDGYKELGAHIIENKLNKPEPKMITDHRGIRVPDVEGVRPYQEPNQGPSPSAGAQDYALAKQTGFKGSYLDFIKAKNQSDQAQPLVSPVDTLGRRANDAENVISAIDTAEGQAGFMTTGLIGQVMGNLGGTDAYNLRATVETIKANIGFDRLQRMREESKTGGALGNVAIQELTALQATIASLDPNQEAHQLRRNLRKVRSQYMKAIEAYNAAKSAGSGGFADPEKEKRYQEFKARQQRGG